MAATTIAIRTMKAAQIAGPGAEFEIVEREVPEPGPGQVRIKVQACGICHSDALTKDGHLPVIGGSICAINVHLYVRESTLRQVFENTESAKRQ